MDFDKITVLAFKDTNFLFFFRKFIKQIQLLANDLQHILHAVIAVVKRLHNRKSVKWVDHFPLNTSSRLVK